MNFQRHTKTAHREQEGNAIEGLYAVGCCSSGVAGYWAGGACIAQGCVMSYVATKHIASK